MVDGEWKGEVWGVGFERELSVWWIYDQGKSKNQILPSNSQLQTPKLQIFRFLDLEVRIFLRF